MLYHESRYHSIDEVNQCANAVIAWGLCPLARRKGSLTLDRGGLPSLPRGCVIFTLTNGFDPLVQAG